MSLQRKTVTVNGAEYEVREISIGEVLPILPRLQVPEEQQEAQMEIMRMCIAQNGQPMGERVSELGISAFLNLAEEVMQINGLAVVGKD